MSSNRLCVLGHLCYSTVRRLFISMTLSHGFLDLSHDPPTLFKRGEKKLIHVSISTKTLLHVWQLIITLNLTPKY